MKPIKMSSVGTLAFLVYALLMLRLPRYNTGSPSKEGLNEN